MTVFQRRVRTRGLRRWRAGAALAALLLVTGTAGTAGTAGAAGARGEPRAVGPGTDGPRTTAPRTAEPRTAEPRATAPRTDWSRIDAFVRGRLDATGTPGAALAVIEGGRVVHERGFGEDGRGRPVTPGTPFLWGSVSKPVTGVAVMQLAEAGRIDIDEPVRTYLPWFRLADGAASARITPRHLLTNTSGIPTAASGEVGDRYDNAPSALTRAVRALADVSPQARPGESYAYSSAGYAVLGALVEEVTGQPFGAYLHAKVLGPLGMEHAVVTEGDFARERVAPGHRSVFGRQVAFDAPYDTSGVPFGHVGGSLRDLTRFVRAELGGGALEGRRILSPRTTADTQYGHVRSSTGRYGLGWSVGTLKGTGERTVWKDGALPGFHAMVVMLPESDRAVVVLQNAYHQLRAREFGDAAFGTAQLLSGARPTTTPRDPLVTALPWTLGALSLVLLTALAAPAVRRRGRAHRAAVRARSRTRTTLTTLAATTACLALAGTLWWFPTTMDGTLRMALLWAPDTGWAAVTALALSLLLAAERVALGVRDVRAGRRRGSDGEAGPREPSPVA
ncbi:serine hydrolase domain-containing protein [Streptomyces sp. NPDC050504]|uniref:serine hydrolase domain-containing protein n=1 Tax=Streptomyces sp. NPDC050504 TaxID=3365618 RepID=UPI00378AE4DE